MSIEPMTTTSISDRVNKVDNKKRSHSKRLLHTIEPKDTSSIN